MKKIFMTERKLIEMFLEVEAGRPASELLHILSIEDEKIEEVRNAPKRKLSPADRHFEEWVETIYHKEELYSEADMEFNISESLFIIFRPPYESEN